MDVSPRVIEPDGLDALIGALGTRGYRVVGPVARDGAIVYDEIAAAGDLPAGWTDAQDGGLYRLERREDEALFGYAVGPHSWKRFLFPPRERLTTVRRTAEGLAVEEEPLPEECYAFLGVRSCELHAIAIQDTVFTGGRAVDRSYAARRASAFLVAVNCGSPAGTCFCSSMGTGPRAQAGYDLALTELLDGGHRFLVEAGSEAGAALLAELPGRAVAPADLAAAQAVTAGAEERMGRSVEDAAGLPDLLRRTLESPRWAEVADRCLTCGNCTMVCPTCFCSSVEDTADLTGCVAERHRVWDSCFSVEYSHIHGGAIRPSARSRYRQWLTHKLGTWQEQFGTSGCVGCGRCIAWCPVGIDITEEIAALRETEGARL